MECILGGENTVISYHHFLLFPQYFLPSTSMWGSKELTLCLTVTTKRNSPLKILWEKEKMLVTSIFAFPYNNYFPSKSKFHIFSLGYFVVCRIYAFK